VQCRRNAVSKDGLQREVQRQEQRREKAFRHGLT
jgi:hypothetical protein